MSRQMKDSGIEWIGEIPADWTTGRTKNCFRNHKNIAGEKAEDYERLALTLNGVIKRSKEDITGLQPEAFNSYQVLRKGELVFKLIDLENVSTSRVGLSPYDGIVSPAYIVIEGREGCSTRFGEYFFLSMWQREVFNHMGDDGVRSSLNAGDLLNISYVYPNFSEQERIADYLDQQCAHIDAVIEKTKASIEEYKKLKQAVITQAVTKGIRGDRPMKDSGIEWIGEIPVDWDEAFAFQVFVPVKHKNKGLVETNLLSLSYGKLKRKNINTIGGLLPENFDGYNIIEKGDIVLRLTDLQNDHKSLRVGLSTERGIITSAYLTLRNKLDIDSAYLYYYLHSFDISKGFYGMGAGVRQGLNWEELKHLQITVPSRKEQDEIVEYLNVKSDELDILVEKKEAFLNEIESYKKSLIYEYVTGKKEAPQSCQ